MHFDLRIGRPAAQARQLTVLRLAEQRALGAREDQGVALCELRHCPLPHQGVFEMGKRRMAMLEQKLRVEFDLSGRGVETTADASLDFGMLAVASLKRDAPATRLSA